MSNIVIPADKETVILSIIAGTDRRLKSWGVRPHPTKPGFTLQYVTLDQKTGLPTARFPDEMAQFGADYLAKDAADALNAKGRLELIKQELVITSNTTRAANSANVISHKIRPTIFAHVKEYIRIAAIPSARHLIALTLDRMSKISTDDSLLEGALSGVKNQFGAAIVQLYLIARTPIETRAIVDEIAQGRLSLDKSPYYTVANVLYLRILSHFVAGDAKYAKQYAYAGQRERTDDWLHDLSGAVLELADMYLSETDMSVPPQGFNEEMSSLYKRDYAQLTGLPDNEKTHETRVAYPPQPMGVDAFIYAVSKSLNKAAMRYNEAEDNAAPEAHVWRYEMLDRHYARLAQLWMLIRTGMSPDALEHLLAEVSEKLYVLDGLRFCNLSNAMTFHVKGIESQNIQAGLINHDLYNVESILTEEELNNRGRAFIVMLAELFDEHDLMTPPAILNQAMQTQYLEDVAMSLHIDRVNTPISVHAIPASQLIEELAKKNVVNLRYFDDVSETYLPATLVSIEQASGRAIFRFLLNERVGRFDHGDGTRVDWVR